MDFSKIKFIVFDFDGVFTNNQVFVSETGEEFVACSRSDGLGLTKLKKIKVDHMILSTETNGVVKKRAEKLKITCIHGCDNKPETLKLEAAKRKVDLSQVAYVGNDTNDLECLKVVGFPMVVADAHADVAGLGKYTTKAKGGYGAVREICDRIYAAYGGAK